MSAARARQKPPPMAAPFTAAMTGWCSRRMVVMTSSSSSMERSAMVGRVSPSMLGMVPGFSWSAPEQNPRPGAGDDDDPDVVVVADLPQRVAEGDHDVEGHGVHALRPVERHDGDVGVGPGDFGEGHARHRRGRDLAAVRS